MDPRGNCSAPGRVGLYLFFCMVNQGKPTSLLRVSNIDPGLKTGASTDKYNHSRLCGDGWWRGGCRRWMRGCCLLVNAGDHTVWDPGGRGEAGAELWTHLLFCRAVWHLRCCRAAEGQVFTAATVVALVASWVQRAIRLDWLRVTSDLAGESASLPTLVQYSHTL